MLQFNQCSNLALAFILPLRALQLPFHGVLVETDVPRVSLAPEVAPDLGQPMAALHDAHASVVHVGVHERHPAGHQEAPRVWLVVVGVVLDCYIIVNNLNISL